MKPILSITEKEFATLPSATSTREQGLRRSIIMSAGMLSNYEADWSELNGLIATSSISANISYVNNLFKIVSYLHQYYEFSQRHFELLDCAAKNIERLYNKKIQELMSNPEAIVETRAQLVSCLEKITLTFQTAADKTEDKQRALVHALKATQYNEKANMYLGAKHQGSYIATIQGLYQKYSQEPLIGSYLQLRANECQIKLEEEMLRSAPRSASSSFSSDTSSITASPQFFAPPATDEAQPLLTRRNVVADKFSLDS